MKADEAMSNSAADRRAERKRRAVIGPLPDSFLRIPGAGIDQSQMTKLTNQNRAFHI